MWRAGSEPGRAWPALLRRGASTRPSPYPPEAWASPGAARFLERRAAATRAANTSTLDRRRSLVVTFSIIAISAEIGLGAGALGVERLRPGSPVVSGPVDLTARPLPDRDAAAIRALLVRRSAALVAGQRDAFLDDLDAHARDFRTRQAGLFDNVRGVPLASWTYAVRERTGLAVDPALPRRYGADTWVGEVDLSYGLDGFADDPLRSRQYLTFVRRSGRWFLAGDDDLESSGLRSERGPWDFGRVLVRRSPHGLVLAHPAHQRLAAEVEAMVGRAAPRISRAWGSWQGRAIVIVASDAEEVRALVPGEDDVGQIAAVTASTVDQRGMRPVGERIVVNPGPFASLAAAGRQVVIQHEVAHLAANAVTSSSTPVWLAEGFAEHLGHAGVSSSPREAALALAAEVADGRIPADLPSEGEFAPDDARLLASYEASWLACRLIAERVGEDGLVRFYRTVGSGPGDPDASLDSGLRSVLGMTTAEFVAEWRRYLVDQLA